MTHQDPICARLQERRVVALEHIADRVAFRRRSPVRHRGRLMPRIGANLRPKTGGLLADSNQLPLPGDERASQLSVSGLISSGHQLAESASKAVMGTTSGTRPVRTPRFRLPPRSGAPAPGTSGNRQSRARRRSRIELPGWYPSPRAGRCRCRPAPARQPTRRAVASAGSSAAATAPEEPSRSKAAGRNCDAAACSAPGGMVSR